MMRRLLAGLIALVTATPLAFGQGWPAKPVRVIVPFAPGGTVDLLCRLVGERLGASLGQPFVVENRPGAGGNIGAEAVARAAPDGYTLLISGAPTHAVNPTLYKKLAFDPIKDFTQIALIGASPNLLVVNPSAPVQSVQDLVKLAQQKPGELSYSTAGPGTSGHLAAELMRSQMKLDVRHVPYKGQADAISGVIRGDVAFSFVTVPATLPHVKAGRLRAIGITSLARSPLAPNVPTVAESGVPDFEVLGWYAMYAPRGVPGEVVSRLTGELDQLMVDAGVKEKLAQLGVEAKFMTGRAFAEFSQTELEKWGRVIRASGATAD
jgi:tripartite-type tricarboxylate transporter receptor subunit TctC